MKANHSRIETEVFKTSNELQNVINAFQVGAGHSKIPSTDVNWKLYDYFDIVETICIGYVICAVFYNKMLTSDKPQHSCYPPTTLSESVKVIELLSAVEMGSWL